MSKSSRFIQLSIFLIASIFWSGCGASTSTPSSPMQEPSSALSESSDVNISGPQLGTYMAFGDGSVLVFIPSSDGADNNGQKGFWMTVNVISNYQYSLCVQAKKCQPPADATALKDYNDPAMEDAAVEISDQTASNRYCSWMGGRLPTDAELKALGDGSVHGFGEISVHAFGPEYDLNGDGKTSMSGFRFEDLGLHGLRCVVDHPLPMPQFTQTAPYYDPNVIRERMTAVVQQTHQFCQNDMGYQTLDLALVDEDNGPISLNNVASLGSSKCQTLENNRVVCYGAPNTNTQAEVGLLCDGFRPACQIGSGFDGDGCSNNMYGAPIQGMDDWEMDGNGVLVPSNGTQLPTGGVLGPAVQGLVTFHGVMVVHSLSTNALPANGENSNGISTNGSSSNGSSSNGYNGDGLAGNGMGCPAGYYFDQGAQGCVSLGTPQTSCLAGYEHTAYGACKSNDLDGNYPGCPTGQVFDAVAGLCDPVSKIVSATALIQTTTLPVELPDCSVQTKKPAKDNGTGSDSSGGLCPAGQTYVCSGIAVITCSCK